MSSSANGTRQYLRSEILRDLRTTDALLVALGDEGQPANPSERIRTPWDRPENEPISLIVDVYGSAGYASEEGTLQAHVSESIIIEAGVTASLEWRRRARTGSNAALAVDAILDGFENRAKVGFGIDGLRSNGRFSGGTAATPPDEGGEMSAVTQWRCSITQAININR